MKLKTALSILICFLTYFLKGEDITSPVDSTQKLTLIFAGDIMGHTPQIKSAQIKKNKSYNYRPCFEYIAPILRNADLAIGNLEVTLPGEPPYTGYPIFRSPDDLARDLSWAGFDVLMTANNHSNDGRKKGVIHTIETLRNVGIHQTGTFKNKRERSLFYPMIINKNGFKLAFLNYTYGTNNIETTPPTIVNEINLFTIKQDLAKAKRLQPDVIIVFLHWGDEYQLIENTQQQYIADWLARKGVDLVIGAHPHVVQPVVEKEVKQADGTIHQTLIAYSLGNFISNQNKQHTDGGILLEVELVKNQIEQSTSVRKARFIPVWRHIAKKNAKSIYQVLPISALEVKKSTPIRLSSEDKKAMKAFARVTRSRLRHNGAKEKRLYWADIYNNRKIAEK